MAQKIFCIINDPKTMFFTPFYFAREEHCKTWTAPRKSPDTTTTTTTPPRLFGDQSFKIIYFRLRGKSSLLGAG